jgi:hypothetical protein
MRVARGGNFLDYFKNKFDSKFNLNFLKIASKIIYKVSTP